MRVHLPNVNKPKKPDIASQYKPIRKIGEGAFANVFEVERLIDKKRFALKVVKLEKISDFNVVETYNESRILKQLNHPCIIKFIESFIAKKEQTFNIITEYVKKGDLNNAISQYKKNKEYVPEDLILDWCTQISLALAFIHKKKIIHRDIKPQNLYISGHGIIKVGDFGISKSLFFANQQAQTVVGTPLYMAPEIVEGKKYQFPVDMWSLGVILYELMALSLPFYSESLASIYTKILIGKYPPLPDYYSKDLRNIVDSLLQIDPEKRLKPNDILKLPLIINRVHKRLTEINFNLCFSQSIIGVYVSINTI